MGEEVLRSEEVALEGVITAGRDIRLSSLLSSDILVRLRWDLETGMNHIQ